MSASVHPRLSERHRAMQPAWAGRYDDAPVALLRGHGMPIGSGGPYANVLRIAPPLTLSTPEADEGLAALGRALAGVDGRPQAGDPPRGGAPRRARGGTT